MLESVCGQRLSVDSDKCRLGKVDILMRNSLFIAVIFVWSSPAISQNATGGHVPASSVGKAGQRGDLGLPTLNVGPIDSRIQNRVQSRIRNRIDRFYDPQANAASPFDVASDEIKNSSRPIRR